MNRLIKIVNFLVCISPIFVNLPTRFIFGEFGRSMANFLFPILFLLILLKKRSKLTKEMQKVLGFILLVILYIVISLFLYLKAENPVYLYGEDVVLKSIKLLCYLLSSITLYVYVIIFFPKKINEILKNCYFSNIFLLIILIVEIFNKSIIDSINFGIGGSRIRLLTAESSWTGQILIFYYIMGYLYFKYLKKGKMTYFILNICFVLQLLNSGSKLFLLMGSLNLILINILFLKNTLKSKILKLFIFTVSILISVVFFFPVVEKLSGSIKNDLINYTSFATRFYTIFISLLVSLKDPFSAGGTFLFYFSESLKKYLCILEKLNLNTFEIKELLMSETSRGLAVKSGILSVLQFYGLIPFLIFLNHFIFKHFKNLRRGLVKEKKIILLLFILNLIALPLFDDILTRPTFFLTIGLLVVFKKRMRKKIKGLQYHNFIKEV